ncbi:MAG: quinone-dependent dihydroorotate dehydrogenase [Anaerolineales bacterium]|nr:quinone-dependent dihydroorotate dehydrogenase [Anaerolineales bacterium]
MYALFRPWLFRLDPERAHALTIQALQLVQILPPLQALLRASFRAPQRPVEAFGLRFSNPVGLAAGYDKDGLAWRGLACLGFGHIEVGTVTWRPQPGNPRPRVFRLPADQALINRMGFPGQGADQVQKNLNKPRPAGLVLGVNIGKNKDTPLEEAGVEYRALLRQFAGLADYLVVNVSSPNTVGLRRMQERAILEELLEGLQAERLMEEARLGKRLPLLVKLAPDLSAAELEEALGVIRDKQMDGVIAANTTLSRDGLQSAAASESGGLSGAPLTRRSLEFVRRIRRMSGGKLPVIGVGGVMYGSDAQAMLEAGASLVQVYTGLVYQGPGLVKSILSSL